MDSDTPQPVPEDFPRSRHPAAVSGFQLKVPLRLVDGKFVDGWTDAELRERFAACADLVEQLTVYCHRKLAELAGTTPANLLPRVRRGVLNKGWDLTELEVQWIMERVGATLSKPAVGDAAQVRPTGPGPVMRPRPIIFLDLDDVIVLNRGASFDKHHLDELDANICVQLIHPPAGQALTELLDEFAPSIVVTSNWVRFTTRPAFERLLRLGGYEQAAMSLHDAWCAPRRAAATRVQVIEDWLAEHHRDEPYVVIDDPDSGSSLLGSAHDRAGRVMLCPVGTGLHHGHLPFVRAALTAPFP
jgi:hypothetical protein